MRHPRPLLHAGVHHFLETPETGCGVLKIPVDQQHQLAPTTTDQPIISDFPSHSDASASRLRHVYNPESNE